MIQFLCPGCQQSFTVDNSRANSIGTCPKCSSRFYVPESPDAPAPPPPQPVRKSMQPVEPISLKRHRYEDDEPRRNSRKRTDDWDDEDDEEEYDEPVRRTKRRRKKKKSQGIFEDGNSFSTFLLGYVGITILLICVSFAVPLVIYLPIFLGMFVNMFASMWLTLLTFKDSIEAGLMCMFIPFYGLFYLINNFDYLSKPFYLSLVTAFMMLICIGIMAMRVPGGP